MSAISFVVLFWWVRGLGWVGREQWGRKEAKECLPVSRLHAPAHGHPPPYTAPPTPFTLHPTTPQSNEEWAAKKAHAKTRPATMLEELKAAARACQPGVQYPAL